MQNVIPYVCFACLHCQDKHFNMFSLKCECEVLELVLLSMLWHTCFLHL